MCDSGIHTYATECMHCTQMLTVWYIKGKLEQDALVQLKNTSSKLLSYPTPSGHPKPRINYNYIYFRFRSLKKSFLQSFAISKLPISQIESFLSHLQSLTKCFSSFNFHFAQHLLHMTESIFSTLILIMLDFMLIIQSFLYCTTS